jgi:small subunit ribosomal protein S3
MGQKVSPIGLRIGINKSWNSSWYATKKDFAKNLL